MPDDVLLMVNRAFAAWRWTLLYCNPTIWRNGECKPSKCAETIHDFVATLSLNSWKEQLTSATFDAKVNTNAIAVLHTAMNGSVEDVAQAIVNIGEEHWPPVCEWFGRGLPELLEFEKLKPNPSNELFFVQFSTLKNYKNDEETLREIMDNASVRWPEIRDLSRSAFGHQSFTWKTLEVLYDWLLRKCAGDQNQLGWLNLTEVASLLSTASNKTSHPPAVAKQAEVPPVADLLRRLLGMADRGLLSPSAILPEFVDTWNSALRDGLVVALEGDECALTDKGRAMIAKESSPYTIGWLIGELESSEKTKEWIEEEYKREEAKYGKIGADGWRFRAEAFGLFHPDPSTMLGIDRIEHLCDAEFQGSGLSVANVRRLRVMICKNLKWNSEQAKCADGLTLVDAADVLEGIQRIPWQIAIPAANAAAKMRKAEMTAMRNKDLELSELPTSVFRLLELLDGKPNVPWAEIPADLHDAWRIARNRDLITTNTADPYIDAERHECYRDRFAYWLTESGKNELALHRGRLADQASDGSEGITDISNSGPKTPREGKQILEPMAMALLLTIGPNAKRISEQVGVPRTTLMSWPTFKAAYDKKKLEVQKEKENRRQRFKAGDREEDENDE